MRSLIISDIHANLPALEAVLSESEIIDEVWCLGDIVGYGPDPNQCIERIQQLDGLTCVLGNHDAAVLGLVDINSFNADARRSLEWLTNELSPASLSFLETLPETVITETAVTLVHGSPRNPTWEYVIEQQIAIANMDAFETPICLVGHTHIPLVFTTNGNGGCSAEYLTDGLRFFPDKKCIINPGSVGQPRDRDSRAAYLIYDSDLNVFEAHRVKYNNKSVQARILEAGLPFKHASRLANGS